jgi:hypothetical protein
MQFDNHLLTKRSNGVSERAFSLPESMGAVATAHTVELVTGLMVGEAGMPLGGVFSHFVVAMA